jgi:hypothetical protein
LIARPIVALKEAKRQFPPVKGNLWVVVLDDKISYSSAKTLPSGIWRTSTWKTVHEATVGIVSEDS